MRRKPIGPQGHARKQAIFTKHVQRGELVYNEPLMDEGSANAKAHSLETYLLANIHTTQRFSCSAVVFF